MKGMVDMQGISKTDWNMLMREIKAVSSTYREEAYIQIREDIFLELDFNKSKNYFGIDILEGVYRDNGESTGSGVLAYSHGFTPNLLSTAIRIAKKYVGNEDFYTLLSNEQKSNISFHDYFSEQTGIPYHDLVVY